VVVDYLVILLINVISLIGLNET